MKKSVKGYECRFAVHIRANKYREDTHMVKEIVHYEDGTTEPRLRLIKNFKRDFYITDLTKRSHKQKKEFEELDNVSKYTCTQSELRDKVADALGVENPRAYMKELSNSPYLYGSDISSTALIKMSCMLKYKDLNTPYKVATYDIETDVVNGSDDPIIITSVFGKDIYLGVDKFFLEGFADPETTIRSILHQYINDCLKSIAKEGEEPESIGDYNVIIDIVHGPVDLIKGSFNFLHERKPDILSIWNMNFDIPKVLDTLHKYGVPAESVLCDPSIPPHLRLCRYKEGNKIKPSADGTESSVNPEDRWHTLYLTASFYVLDSMCVYRLLRIPKGKDPEYNLDFILRKEKIGGKLKFDKADAYKKLDWHIFMQSNYKFVYLAYALWDSLSLDKLDKKIKDLSVKTPIGAGFTDFYKFNSNPKRIADALHLYGLNKGLIINSVGKDDDIGYDDEMTEDDVDIVGLDGWVMTLTPHMSVLGLPLIKDIPNIRTMIRAFNYDSDCTAAYPTCTAIMNVSKSTTKRELININGVDKDIAKFQNLNLSSGSVNGIEYCTNMFGMPNMKDLLAKAKADMK